MSFNGTANDDIALLYKYALVYGWDIRQDERLTCMYVYLKNTAILADVVYLVGDGYV